MVCGAASGVLSSIQKLHNSALPLAARLSDPRDKAQFDTANETIVSLGDVIALLGMDSQEISMQRKYQLQSCLPKEMHSICSNKNLASTNLSGGDLDKALRAARESSKLGANKRGDHRYRPYQHRRNFSGKPFLGKNPSFGKNNFGKGGRGVWEGNHHPKDSASGADNKLN